MKDAFRTLLYFAAAAVSCFLIHTIVFRIWDFGYEAFRFTLSELYAFFAGCSMIILVVVHIIEKRNKDIVGLSFLLASSLKMVIAGILAKVFLLDGTGTQTENFNFLLLFILFLAIESILTIRILNKKQ